MILTSYIISYHFIGFVNQHTFHWGGTLYDSFNSHTFWPLIPNMKSGMPSVELWEASIILTLRQSCPYKVCNFGVELAYKILQTRATVRRWIAININQQDFSDLDPDCRYIFSVRLRSHKTWASSNWKRRQFTGDKGPSQQKTRGFELTMIFGPKGQTSTASPSRFSCRFFPPLYTHKISLHHHVWCWNATKSH